MTELKQATMAEVTANATKPDARARERALRQARTDAKSAWDNLRTASEKGLDGSVRDDLIAAAVTRMKLRPGVLDFLTWCRKNGIVTCILTDLTADIQFKKMIHLKIDKLIDWVVSSEEAGADKPHKSMFRLALKKMGLSRSDVLMIGDNYHKDILGAKALGIRTVLSK